MSENQGDQGSSGGSDQDKQKKGPKLFKPADAQPKEQPAPAKPGPKLFKAADATPKVEPKQEKAAPKLFRSAPPMPEQKKEEPKPQPEIKTTPPAPLTLPKIEPKPVAPIKSEEQVAEPIKGPEEPRKVSVPPPKISLPKISSRITKPDEKEKEPEEKMEIEKSLEKPEGQQTQEAQEEDQTLESAKKVKQKLEEAKKKNIEAAKAFRKSRASSLSTLSDRLKDTDRMKKSFNAAFLADDIDVRNMWYRAIAGGIVASIMLLFFNYFFYAFGAGSFFDQTFLLTYYSQGKPINEVIGLWAVTYTPLSSFSILDPKWVDDWFSYLGPTMLSAVIIGGFTKNVRYSILGCFFFGLSGIMLAFTFMSVLPFFGVMDPTTIDAGLIATFPNVIENFNQFYSWVYLNSNSVYFGWSVAGSIELSMFAILVAVPSSIVANIINSLFEKEIVVAK